MIEAIALSGTLFEIVKLKYIFRVPGQLWEVREHPFIHWMDVFLNFPIFAGLKTRRLICWFEQQPTKKPHLNWQMLRLV